LKLSYTELLAQPEWWVADMVTLIKQRDKVRAIAYEKANRQTQNKTRLKP
jgi:hypothetical protein